MDGCKSGELREPLMIGYETILSQGSRFQSAFKVQRSSRKGVGSSDPKRRTPHWGDDMISSAGRPVAALHWAVSASRTLAKITKTPLDMHGVGIQEMRGIGKLRFGTDPTVDTTKPVDAGIVSVFTAAIADT
jgi:hypothetical protein